MNDKITIMRCNSCGRKAELTGTSTWFCDMCHLATYLVVYEGKDKKGNAIKGRVFKDASSHISRNTIVKWERELTDEEHESVMVINFTVITKVENMTWKQYRKKGRRLPPPEYAVQSGSFIQHGDRWDRMTKAKRKEEARKKRTYFHCTTCDKEGARCTCKSTHESNWIDRPVT